MQSNKQTFRPIQTPRIQGMMITLETIGKLNYKDLNTKQDDDFKPSDVIDMEEEYFSSDPI